ncbi:MAG: hypothetical protein BAJALOKI2v1_810016, partial [Promethearchaeota archaeon]
MKNNNSIFTRKLGKTRADKLKLALCLFFVFLFLTNIFAFINLNDSRKPIPGNAGEIYDDGSTVLGSDKPSVSAYTNNISLFEAPYNYTKSWAFFEEKYENETALDLPFSTYYRKGDKEGTILEDLIYSQDQLFLYKTLLKEQLTDQELFERYLHLENSDLWYNGSGADDYGFMRSYNTTSKQIEDDNRYLIDNLMVIFTLLEEIGGNLDQITVNGTQPLDSVEKMFELVNSSEFYDDALGFKTLNDTNYKDVK